MMLMIHNDIQACNLLRRPSRGAWNCRQSQCFIIMCVCLLCWLDSGVGTIYVSDDRGAVFSKSLERHLYTKTGSDTDFTTITSLRGVYMTSVLTEGESAHRVTCICLDLWVQYNKYNNNNTIMNAVCCSFLLLDTLMDWIWLIWITMMMMNNEIMMFSSSCM